MNVDEKTARERLLMKKQELETLQAISADARSSVELDQQSVGRLSRMDALQGQAMAQEHERRRRKDLIRIDAALSRLSDGDYGYCLDCGEEIAERRLEIDPMATLCVRCAGLHERT